MGSSGKQKTKAWATGKTEFHIPTEKELRRAQRVAAKILQAMGKSVGTPKPKDERLKFDCLYTLEEIGYELNITRERARQLQNQALKKLRKKCDRRGLTLEDLF